MPLHNTEEETGRLKAVDQITVTMEYAVQGEGTLLAPHPKTLECSCLQGGLISLGPKDRIIVIARPTQTLGGTRRAS